jgi:hypothetical protein
MTLYEVDLIRTNGQTETRYTDVRLVVGGSVTIDGRPARVVSDHLDTKEPGASRRFVCEHAAVVESES